VSSRIWTVAKPDATPITGSCPTATPHYWSGPASTPVQDATVLATQTLKNEDGTDAGTPVPANTADSSVNGYVVAARDPFTASKIMAWHVNATGALVADGDIAVSAYSPPAAVPQPGTTDQLDSLDERLTQAVAHADPDAGGAEAVWTQHTINGPGGRSVARWYEFLPATKTKRQEGNISDPGNFVFNAAISPTMSGNEAVIQYNLGSRSQLAQIWAQSRKSAQPLNAMSTPVKLGDSVHFDQDFSCPSQAPPGTSTSCRWGDYAGASPDPAAGTGQPDGPEHRVWGTNQLNGSPRFGDPAAPHWVTRNFALVPERLAPTASMTANPQTATRTTSVAFDGSGSRDTELPGGIASYAWDFDGDGTTDQTTTTPTTTHTYAALGTFTARLVVTDSDDGLASAPATLTVTVQNIAPTASLAASTARRVAGVRTTLSAAASQDPDGSIVNYRWDLDGNGTFETNTGATPTANKTFPRFGTFRVGLQVTDSDGAINATTASLAVSPAPMKLTLTFPRKAKLKSVLAGGLRGNARCRHSCKVTLVVSVPRKVARKLGTKTTLIRRTIRITGTGPKRVKLVLGKKTKAALGRANMKSVAVTLRGTATVKTSRTSRAKRTVRVVR
jgi:PKD domain-containing protein